MTDRGSRSSPPPPGRDAGPAPELVERVARWIAHDPDPDTRAELQRLQDEGAWTELAARFAGRLTFGTAGLRAELGAGPLRMNRLVVREAAAGLVHYLQDHGHPEPLVVIGFDARHHSDRFAAETAAVVAGAGGRAVVFDRPGPTPLLAYAVRRLGAAAGVMVTASHNPAADNGYKVYLGDGAQIVPPVDAEIARRIALAGFDVPLAGPDHPSIATLDGTVADDYLAVVVGQLTPSGSRRVRVAYTALHGVGAPLALAAFAAAGFPPPHVVAEQAQPDPDFPTVPFPNPEEPGAMDLGLALAASVDADLLVANDPDADRLGVAVPTAGGVWQVLTGDEIGVLLAEHLLRHRDRAGERLLVTTLVSSRLLSRLAAAHGVHYAETLTGFKWIVRPGLEHPEWTFVLGYEEALGFSVGSTVRDKDGIAAALVFAELVAGLRADGLTVQDRLEQLARRFGLHATVGYSLRFAGSGAGAARAAAAMQRARTHPLTRIGDAAVVGHRDLGADPAPYAADVLVWDLADGGRVVMRPSGTEPKLKVYLEVVEPVPAGRAYAAAREAATARLARLRDDLGALLADG